MIYEITDSCGKKVQVRPKVELYMLRALLAMKLITEEEYKRIVKLNAEHYKVEI